MMIHPICARGRLVEHEVAQGFILGDPARLRPDGLAGRRRHPADDHIADFTFGMATDHMNDFRGTHALLLLIWRSGRLGGRAGFGVT
jgi:hypothetical protein